jgi:major vault protein
MTDIIEVETKDHARLRLTLCYSWKFEVLGKDKLEEANKLFKVNDFIGDACKNLAAKIRGAVSTVQFEVFHKNSASIVKSAVFGVEENNMTRSFLKFESNNLLVINVDIHTQEPIDVKTRENLSKSTNLSIQSQNAMQQADTEHRQKIITEENKGKLQLQVLDDNTSSEKQNIEYLKKKVETEVVRSTGEMKAKANASARRFEIEGESKVSQAKMKVEAQEIEILSDLVQKEINIREEMRKREELIDLELDKLSRISEIEIEEFRKTVKAIGKDTIISMARAGPDVQQRLLHSLGIKSFLITDGKNPINLFNTARGIIKDKK